MKKNLRTIIVVVICAGLCVGYFLYLNYRPSSKDKEPTEMEQLINKDLEQSYPSSPRDVVKFFNRILLCLYNEEYTDKEFTALASQGRKLFDEELQKENPEEEYFARLKAELDAAGKEKKKLSNPSIASAKEVDYKKVQGDECAYVDVSYYVRGESSTERVDETYILRKDSEGKWKILGFY